MKNMTILLMALLTSGFVSAQGYVGAGLENSVKTHRTEATSPKLMPLLTLGYNLELSKSFTIDSFVTANTNTARTGFNYVLDINDGLKAHVGLNLNLVKGIGAGMQSGLLLNDKYLIEYVKTNSSFDNPEWSSDSLAVGVKFGF